jgi:hypothetical protein
MSAKIVNRGILIAAMLVIFNLTVDLSPSDASPVVSHSAFLFSTVAASQYGGSGDGDGWGLAFTQDEVFNVFHHASTLTVACHKKVDASDCWTPRTITDPGTGSNFATSGQPGLWIDPVNQDLYLYATRASDGTGGVVCVSTTEAASNTDPFCGFTALSAVGGAPISGGISAIGDGVTVGTSLFAFNYVSGSTAANSENELLCFDTSTKHPCAGQPYVVPIGGTTVSAGAFPPPAAAAIASDVILPITVDGVDKLLCFDGATKSQCSGSWPISPGLPFSSISGAPFPLLNSKGSSIGFCIPDGTDQCYSLAGTLLATPTGVTSTIPNTSGWNGPSVQAGTKVYVPDGNSDQVLCFDAAINASCMGFPVSFPNLGLLYTVSTDPYLPGCLWVNSDDGSEQIQNFDAATGGACDQNSVAYQTSNVIASSTACIPRNFNQLRVLAPSNAVSASATLTVETQSGASIPNQPTVVEDSTGAFSLLKLKIPPADGLPELVIHFNSTTQIRRDVQVELSWTGSTSQACLAGQPYAALGDSYSSGEGLPAKATEFLPPSNVDGCDRASNAYPEFVATALHETAATKHWFVACSGVTTGDSVLASSEDPDFLSGKTLLGGVPATGTVPGEAPQPQALSKGTQEMTVTIGGNDTGFARVAADCMADQLQFRILTVHQTYVTPSLGDALDGSFKFQKCSDAISAAQFVAGDGTSSSPLGSALIRVYTSLLQSAPNARLLVLNYPQLLTRQALPKTGFCQLTGAVTVQSNPFNPAASSVTSHLGFTSTTQAAVNQIEGKVEQDIANAVSVIDSTPAYVGRIALANVGAKTRDSGLSCDGSTVGNADVNGIEFAAGAGVTNFTTTVPYVIACKLFGKGCTEAKKFNAGKFLAGRTLHPREATHRLMAGLAITKLQQTVW